MILLSIETSCDETAVAIVKRKRGTSLQCDVLSHIVLSQASLHSPYGGVYPMLAKREHAKALPQIIANALKEANLLVERTNDKKISAKDKAYVAKLFQREQVLERALTVLFEGIQKPKVDAIAITAGPGLPPALWVGVNVAQALGTVWNIPVYPINHMEAHVLVSLASEKGKHISLEAPSRPSIALLLSGGHTELVQVTGKRTYSIIGETKDDAVGEAFDKVARLMGLPYPGGPAVSARAERARARGEIIPNYFELPRPMLHSHDCHFSMSGLKTAVLTAVQKKGELTEDDKDQLCLSFENAVADVVRAKVRRALQETGAKSLIFGGGVSANTHLRKTLESIALEEDVALYLPNKSLAGDNALMIAITGLYHIACGVRPKKRITAVSSWGIEEAYKVQK